MVIDVTPAGTTKEDSSDPTKGNVFVRTSVGGTGAGITVIVTVAVLPLTGPS